MQRGEHYKAVQAGEVRYFTGKPCKRGHISWRQTSGRKCSECERTNQNIESKKRFSRWRDRNPERHREFVKSWRLRNKEKSLAITSVRRHRFRISTPSWANKNLMKDFYTAAKVVARLTGIKRHVDHVVPLRSKLVCGLHCEDNLQILTAKDNCSKQSRYWPDMPS